MSALLGVPAPHRYEVWFALQDSYDTSPILNIQDTTPALPSSQQLAATLAATKAQGSRLLFSFFHLYIQFLKDIVYFG